MPCVSRVTEETAMGAGTIVCITAAVVIVALVSFLLCWFLKQPCSRVFRVKRDSDANEKTSTENGHLLQPPKANGSNCLELGNFFDLLKPRPTHTEILLCRSEVKVQTQRGLVSPVSLCGQTELLDSGTTGLQHPSDL
ncbi:hypothetical protein F7725_004858 [Dissostichus mawsoni]|uniref:Uncharacterized protein n=1 Tax=Dissostichus mawsoni TaxID=36200 RepID=A0A7J5XK13_DISMA|nr:hypothetical protein F7725_004858 [Dissostichus mawsoni]